MSERAAASYIPAIHSGYINFMREHPDPLFVLGEDVIETIPKLDRDVRAMEPVEVVTALGALGIARSVALLGAHNLEETMASYDSFVMPNDEANRVFASKNIDTAHSVEFVDTFLRWDMPASLHKLPVETDFYKPNIQDIEMMALARTESEKSPDWWRQVGAVMVTDEDEIIAGHNTHMPSPDYSLNTFGDPRSNFDAGERIDVSKVLHAEARLISIAARDGLKLDGSRLYVTTFPCPNCAKMIAESGVSEVFYNEGYSLLDAVDTLKAFNVTIHWIESTDPS